MVSGTLALTINSFEEEEQQPPIGQCPVEYKEIYALVSLSKSHQAESREDRIDG